MTLYLHKDVGGNCGYTQILLFYCNGTIVGIYMHYNDKKKEHAFVLDVTIVVQCTILSKRKRLAILA